jgi:hypothetical protein
VGESSAGPDYLAERIPMIAAVLFDLYETLITESAIRPARASSSAAILGLEENAYRTEWKKRRLRIAPGEISFSGTEPRRLAAKPELPPVYRVIVVLHCRKDPTPREAVRKCSFVLVPEDVVHTHSDHFFTAFQSDPDSHAAAIN